MGCLCAAWLEIWCILYMRVCKCVRAMAPHRLSHLCPSAPVVSPRPRVPTMHCFHVNAFRHREIIFSFSALLFPLLFYQCILKWFSSFFLFLSYAHIFLCDSSSGIINPHLLTEELTQIFIWRFFFFLIWGKSCALHWSLVHMLRGRKDSNTPHTLHTVL